jgi:GT2 family glycosyltransferase
MITVISYCRHPLAKSIQEGNIAKTVGAAHEYRVLDGSKGPASFAGAYNWALAQAKGDIVVFIADDAYSMQMNWGPRLEAKFAADQALGVVGVAGTQYLFADKCSWTAAGRPFVKGRIVYHLQNGDFFAAVFSPEKGDFPVVACDGCFLAVRAPLFQTLRFDDATFTGAHFWDIDFCVQAHLGQHRVLVSTDLVVKKMAQTLFDAEWHEAGRRFLQKYQAALPLSCAQSVPDLEHIVSSSMVNLKGKASMETIC